MEGQGSYTLMQLHRSKLSGAASLKVHYRSNLSRFYFRRKLRRCHKDLDETCIENYLYSIWLNSCMAVEGVYHLNFTWHVLTQALKLFSVVFPAHLKYR